MFHFPQFPDVFKKNAYQTAADFLKDLPKLPEDPVAVNIDGVLYDLHAPLLHDKGQVVFIMRSDPQALDILRHTAAHVLAQAVQELFPETQVTVGPVTEDGFFYDFYREKSFSTQDLAHIEDRMHHIVQQNLSITRAVYSRPEVLALFQEKGEEFKVRLIEKIPEEEKISVYHQGSFFDLCRGPHLPSTGLLGQGFKLTKVSGAYWQGDTSKTQLQRIYGTVWPTQQDLKNFLLRQEEAQKRDHRRLGREMELFHFQEEAPGAVFWHPNGWMIYQTLQKALQKKLVQEGYVEVNTPQLVSHTLWQSSGHWDKFRENIYEVETEDHLYGLKPMNCPCHVQIFNHSLKSYRDLPLRMAEFGRCMRHEPSGSRAGLMRMTSFVQDDAHIFCTPDQMVEETMSFCRLLFEVYHALGFDDVLIRLSTRPEKRLGEDSLWDQSEAALAKGAQAAGLAYTISPGEGAFYGPKLEFVLKDSLGRLWQCGTLQVDFVLPSRLKAFYVGADGKKHHPVMLHRAILGSFERFLGVYLEHTGGHLPLWLAPVQGVILPITQDVIPYAQQIETTFDFLRLEIDDRTEKLGYKIRELAGKKIPYLLIVGKKEQETQTVTLRAHGGEEVSLSLEELAQKLTQEAQIPF